MPYIDAKFTVPMTAAQETALKEKLGKAIEIVPGKSESWLMVGLQPSYTLYFKGVNDRPAAFIEVSVFGGENKAAFSELTAAICDIFEEVLSIPSDRVYVKYNASTNWGWNRSNF